MLRRLVELLAPVLVASWLSLACDGGSGGDPDVLPDGPDGQGPDRIDGPEGGELPVQRIVAGTVDETDTAVVALVAGGRVFCSGTLVASRTVFTAGHCVAGSRLSASEVEVFFGTRVGGAGQSVPVAAWGVHPGYQLLPDGVPLHDVAFVTLSHDAPVAPLPWRATKLPSLVGVRVKMVGYGVTDAEHQVGAGTRRAAYQTIVDQDAAFLYYGDGVSGTCQGDSGGPTLLKEDGVTTLVAVTSYGDETCVQVGGNTRVDTNAEFLAAHVDAPVAVPAPPSEAPPRTRLAPATEVEPNNGYGSSANTLAAPSVVEAALEPVGDVDYYRVVLPRGATLDAVLTAKPDHDVDVRLTNAGGGLLDASENGAGEADAVSWTNVSDSARTVYLRVYVVSGPEGGDAGGVLYRLAVSW